MGRLTRIPRQSASGPGRGSPGLFCSLLAAACVLALRAPAPSLAEETCAPEVEPVGKTAVSAPPSSMDEWNHLRRPSSGNGTCIALRHHGRHPWCANST